MRRVLSFDVGLRNLGAAVVCSRPDWSFPATFVTSTETAAAFHARAFSHFLIHGWTLEQWRVFDVTEILNRPVKNVKRLSVVSKTIALTDTLAGLETEWFPTDAPHTVVTEVQHNGNADMRAVCMGILVFFRRSMPDSELTAVSGSHKLKVCAALGVEEGAGMAAKTAAKAAKKAAAKSPKRVQVNGGAGAASGPAVVPKTTLKKNKYEDNKRRAVLAIDVLLSGKPEQDAMLATHTKKDDLADALLQAVWVLWTLVAPKAPRRSKRRRDSLVADPEDAVDVPVAVRKPKKAKASPVTPHPPLMVVDLTASSP